MIEYCLFPGGTARIVTFSYDDGPENDGHLIALFDKYNVKGTFHLNSKKYLGMSEEELAGIRALYKNHEISCHTQQHGWPSHMPLQSVTAETFEDRKVLEHIAGYPVVGMSYPYGDYNAEVISAMRACGIVYSRTTKNTQKFGMPEDFMAWHPTCHHRDAAERLDAFLLNLERVPGYAPLFYIWGHSYEFRTEEDWAYIENIVSQLANHDNVWYATNIDIYDYVQAQKQLKISADEKVFFNPSAMDVWVYKDKKDILCIKAGETLKLD